MNYEFSLFFIIHNSYLASPFVQPAFLVFRILPPPSAGEGVLPFLYGAGTGLAADGGVALRVEAVGGDFVLPGVAPNLFVAPLQQRIDLEDAAVGAVDLNGFQIGACDA